MKSNKSIGNSFEAEFCEELACNGWWAHNMAQNQAGQPADVIAVKDGRSYLIDCKVCTSDTFSVRRIEENQRSSMTLWRECGNGEGWFAIRIRGEVFMVKLAELEAKGLFTLDWSWFSKNAITLEEWLCSYS